MEYWINSKNVQMGPYSLQQLQLMWQQGQLTADTVYYDFARCEWLQVRELVENVRGLFTAEEAFVRLGENRLKGCLSIFNQKEAIHVFVDGGFVICAMGDKEHGEFALSQALHLEESTYEWFLNAAPPEANLRVNVTEYAMRHALARDIRISNTATRKHNTVALPKIGGDKTEVKLNFYYVLVPEDASASSIRLVKTTSVVGREHLCDVVFNETKVSRKHCLLEMNEHNVKVKDLDSSNGTFINGVPIQDGVLKVGDELSLGGYLVTLHKEQKKAPGLT